MHLSGTTTGDRTPPSDLLVFLLLNVALVFLGAIVKSGLVDNLEGIPEKVAFAPAQFWSNVYEVGPSLPRADSMTAVC